MHTNVDKQLILNNEQSQALALAALLQACHLVRNLASSGMANEYQVKPLLHSLFQFNANHSSEIYADLRLLEFGFNRLYHVLDGNLSTADRTAIQYAVQVVTIADRVLANSELMSIIRSRLEEIEYPCDDDWLVLPKQINTVYTSTISKLSQRIEVKGEKLHLSNELTAARIRCLLFAAIRAAVLWRQTKGNKFKLFFQRGKIKSTVSALSSININ